MAGASVGARNEGEARELEVGHQSLRSIYIEDMLPAKPTSRTSMASRSRRAQLQLDGREKERSHADIAEDNELEGKQCCSMSQSNSTLNKSQEMPFHSSLHSYTYTPPSSAITTPPAANSTCYGYSVASSSTSCSASSDDLLDLLRESLHTSPRSSAWPSPASTTRTTTSPSSSSASSSGPPSPPHASRSSTSSRRKSASAAVTAPITASTHALSSVISKTSKVATSLVTVHQAISLSLYILVSLIASITLICILVAGYGLTLADDLKYKIGILGQKADLKRRKLLYDLEEWLRVTNENLKKRQTALEHGVTGSPRKRSRSSYTSTAGSSKSISNDNQQGRPIETLDSFRLYASIAYSKLPFPTPYLDSFSASSTRKEARSRPPSRPIRSRCSSPPPEQASSASSDSSPKASSSSSSSSWNKFPPRPPLSVLIPSMILALLLALVALFKNSRKKTARK